jgi:hypothetical protein
MRRGAPISPNDEQGKLFGEVGSRLLELTEWRLNKRIRAIKFGGWHNELLASAKRKPRRFGRGFRKITTDERFDYAAESPLGRRCRPLLYGRFGMG